jgi:hypothetical protein
VYNMSANLMIKERREPLVPKLPGEERHFAIGADWLCVG